MNGILTVEKNIPMVKTHNGVYVLSGCHLIKHSNGDWNFNMSLDGKYTAYKEGDKVSGMLSISNTFIAWSLLKE